MQHIKFFIFKIKSLIIPVFICVFIIFLLLFSKSNIVAAKAGLSLWANSVLPSLLPFFIATELLGYTNIVSYLGKLLNGFMRPFFNVPGEGSFALLMGIISGYPVGAKIVANLKSQGKCNSIEAERLLAFSNNSGPLFIIGTVGIGMFSSSHIGLILFITHLLSCITVGFLFRWWKKSNRKDYRSYEYELPSSSLSLSNLGEILSKSIVSAINIILVIGGFVVLFSIIISMLNRAHFFIFLSSFFHILGINCELIPGILTGFVEVTNGISNISSISCNINTKIIACSFALGFGGLSVLLQVLSITSKSNISIKPYFIGKILQAFFSAFYTYLLL